VKTPLVYAYLLPNVNANQLEHFAECIPQRFVSYFFQTVNLDEQCIRIQFRNERLAAYALTPFSIAQYLRAMLATMKRNVIIEITFTGLYLCLGVTPYTPETIQHIVTMMRTTWIVGGIPGVESAHVYCLQGSDRLVSITGTNDMNLLDLWDVYPIDFTRTFSNNIVEIQKRLGIDAAKFVLFEEMKASLSVDGSLVHDNHIQLLVDVMTCTGALLKTDRNGLSVFAPDHILTRASFEKNIDILSQAAMNQTEQSMLGISESVMVGSDLVLGTGVSKLQDCDTDVSNSTSDARVFVTTSDWINMEDGELPSWDSYFTVLDTIATQVITTCAELARKTKETSKPQPLQTVQQWPPTESVIARKRKQNDIGTVNYRPSSPILVNISSSVGPSIANNGSKVGSSESNESKVGGISVASGGISVASLDELSMELSRTLQTHGADVHVRQQNHVLSLVNTLRTQALVSSL